MALKVIGLKTVTDNLKKWELDRLRGIEELNIVKNLFPAHSYVEKYIQSSQEKLLGSS